MLESGMSGCQISRNCCHSSADEFPTECGFPFSSASFVAYIFAIRSVILSACHPIHLWHNFSNWFAYELQHRPINQARRTSGVTAVIVRQMMCILLLSHEVLHFPLNSQWHPLYSHPLLQHARVASSRVASLDWKWLLVNAVTITSHS